MRELEKYERLSGKKALGAPKSNLNLNLKPEACCKNGFQTAAWLAQTELSTRARHSEQLGLFTLA
jgi:hypothetical protein